MRQSHSVYAKCLARAAPDGSEPREYDQLSKAFGNAELAGSSSKGLSEPGGWAEAPSVNQCRQIRPWKSVDQEIRPRGPWGGHNRVSASSFIPVCGNQAIVDMLPCQVVADRVVQDQTYGVRGKDLISAKNVFEPSELGRHGATDHRRTGVPPTDRRACDTPAAPKNPPRRAC